LLSERITHRGMAATLLALLLLAAAATPATRACSDVTLGRNAAFNNVVVSARNMDVRVDVDVVAVVVVVVVVVGGRAAYKYACESALG
jgi:uncharacterized lipoprotein YajG